jgi:hypothetical protein
MVTHEAGSGLHPDVEDFASMTIVPKSWEPAQCAGTDFHDEIAREGAENVGEKLGRIKSIYLLGEAHQ